MGGDLELGELMGGRGVGVSWEEGVEGSAENGKVL